MYISILDASYWFMSHKIIWTVVIWYLTFVLCLNNMMAILDVIRLLKRFVAGSIGTYDIKEYVQNRDKFQKMNASFQKSTHSTQFLCIQRFGSR